MAKKRASQSKSSRPSSAMKTIAGLQDQLSSVCQALGVTEEELMERFMGMMGNEEQLEQPPAPRRTRPIDPTAKEWEAFEIAMSIDPDNPRSLKRDLARARKIDPRCAMLPIIQAIHAATHEEELALHREALALLGDRINRDSIEDLCGEGNLLDHPYGAPFLTAHRFLARDEMYLHHYSVAIPHLEILFDWEFDPLDRSIPACCLALCHLHQGKIPAAQACLGTPGDVDSMDSSECMTRALLEFRVNGDTPAANRWLELAEDQNPYIVKMFLRGENDPEFEQVDIQAEAEMYWAMAMPVWRETEGTMPWIRQRVILTKPERKPSLTERKERAEELVEALNEFPLGDDTWRIVVRESVHKQDELPDSIVVAYVTSADGTDLMHTTILNDRPKTEDLLQLLVETCEDHEDLPRPAEVLFEEKRLLRLAERGLKMCEMKARLTAPLPALDRVIEQHLESLREATTLPADTLADVADISSLVEPWMVGFGRIHAWIDVEGRLIRPWFGVVISPEGVRRFLQLTTPSITAADWEGLLCAAMCHPLTGGPGVPQKIIFRNEAQKAAAREVWEALEIETLELGSIELDEDQPDPVMSFILDFSRNMEPESELHHALSTIDGITDAELQQFYAAACEYHRAAPWRLCGEQTALVLKGGNWPEGRVMCTMGEAGVTQGLAVYPTQLDFATARRGGRTTSLVVLFDEPQLAAFPDLDLMEARGWPISSEQAYPVAFLNHGPHSLELPSRSDIQMLTAALRMIPQLVKNPLQPVVTTDAQGQPLTLSPQLEIFNMASKPTSGSKKGKKK